MAVLGWILLGLLALCLAVVVILVATPMHLRVEAEAGERTRIVLDMRTLWGVSPRLRLVDSDRPGGWRPDRPSKRKRRGKRDGGGWSLPGGPGTARQLIRGLPEVVRGEFARIHVDRLELDARFGTGDPADTGRLYGYLTPLAYALPARRVSVILRPDFANACFQGRAEAALHLIPGALVWPLLRLAWQVFVRPS